MSKANPVVGMRLDPDTLARLDQLAGAYGVTRGVVVLHALKALPDWPRSAVATPQLPGQIALGDLSEAVQKAMPSPQKGKGLGL